LVLEVELSREASTITAVALGSAFLGLLSCSAGARRPGGVVAGSIPSAASSTIDQARFATLIDSLLDDQHEIMIDADSLSRVSETCAGVRLRPGEGAVAGRVRSARTDVPQSDVEIAAGWRSSDTTFAGTTSRPRARVRSDSAGRFIVCGVPRFTPVELWPTASRDEMARVRVQLGARTIAAYDLLLEDAPASAAKTREAVDESLADSSAIGALRGRILTLGGDGLPNAEVLLDRPRRRVVTDTAGRFRFTGVQAGVRTLEVRAIGYRPLRVGVPVRKSQDREHDITIDRTVAVLGAMTVRASRGASWDSAGFDERRRKGSGYFFSREALDGIADLATALRLVPGIRGRSNDRSQRLVAGRGAGCYPAFVVNRVRFEAGGAIGPEAMIRAQDIRAMEVYSSRLSIPPEHQRYADCAVIVIWLREAKR